MGGAFYGLSDDQYALFYNPAGLNVARESGQGMLAITADASPSLSSGISAISSALSAGSNDPSSLITNLQTIQGTPMHAGVGLFNYYHWRGFAVGLLVADTKVNVISLGKELDSQVEVTAISDNGLYMGFGGSAMDEKLYWGFTPKFNFRLGGFRSLTVADLMSNSALFSSAALQQYGGFRLDIDSDLGAIYDFPEPPLGLVTRMGVSMNNIFKMAGLDLAVLTYGTGTPKLVPTVNFGFYSVLPGWGWIDNFHVVADFAELGFGLAGETDDDKGARAGSFLKHLNFGVEMPMNGWFSTRLGIHQGNLAAGIGMNLRAVRLELATYAEEVFLGPGRMTDRRVALTLEFGMSAAPAAPITRKGFKVTPNVIAEQELPSEKAKRPKLPPPPLPAPTVTPSPPTSTEKTGN